MTEERQDGVTGRKVDDVFDDLRRALAIEPSFDFAARVRARVSDDRARGWRWRGSRAWLIAFVPAAAAIVLALQVLPTQTPAPAVRPVVAEPSRAEIARTETRIEPRIETPAVPALEPRASTPATRNVQANRTSSRAVMTAATATPRSEPEVIVPGDQRVALIRLLEAARAGQVVLGPGASATDLLGELTPPAPLEVQPIVIPLLPGTPDSAEGSGRQ